MSNDGYVLQHFYLKQDYSKTVINIFTRQLTCINKIQIIENNKKNPHDTTGQGKYRKRTQNATTFIYCVGKKISASLHRSSMCNNILHHV